jgi:hypothetical protein
MQLKCKRYRTVNASSLENLRPNATLCLLFLLLSLLACSSGPSRKDVVKAYETAANAHKIPSLISLFSDDSQFQSTGMELPLLGKEAIAQKARYDSTLNNIIRLTITRTKRDTIFATAIETNQWLSSAGLAPSYYSSIAFVVVNGKIKTLNAELSDSSVAAINNIMNSLIPWAQEYEPEKLNQLLSGGVFSYTAQSAALSLELLRDWRQKRE